jgi:hypothetical protein
MQKVEGSSPLQPLSGKAPLSAQAGFFFAPVVLRPGSCGRRYQMSVERDLLPLASPSDSRERNASQLLNLSRLKQCRQRLDQKIRPLHPTRALSTDAMATRMRTGLSDCCSPAR